MARRKVVQSTASSVESRSSGECGIEGVTWGQESGLNGGMSIIVNENDGSSDEDEGETDGKRSEPDEPAQLLSRQNEGERDKILEVLLSPKRYDSKDSNVSEAESAFVPEDAKEDDLACKSSSNSVKVQFQNGNATRFDTSDTLVLVDGKVVLASQQQKHPVPNGNVKFSVNKDRCNRNSGRGRYSEGSTFDSDTGSEGSTVHLEAQPPDGGWGWVVVAASFMINLIADGVTFSFGVIFVEFLSYFGESKGKTAWVGSLFMSIPLLSGPIASSLTDRYGCRRVTIVGALLATAGFVISSFTDSLEVLFITFGIMSGFGLSLCYVAAVVIVAYYFEKRRSFATGLSVCGSGIGTFIFAPLTQYLIKEYGWRGTTLILAGFFLNMCVCGALMRDLKWTKRKYRSMKSLKTSTSCESFSTKSHAAVPSTEEMRRLLVSGQAPDYHAPSDVSDVRMFSSLISLPTFVKGGEKVPIEVLEMLSANKNLYNLVLQNYPSLLMARSLSDQGSLNRYNQVETRVPVYSEEERRNVTSPTGEGKPHLIHLQARRLPYLKDLRVHRRSLTYRGAMLNIHRYRLKSSSCPDIYRNSMTTIAKEKEDKWYAALTEMKEVLSDMLDFSHFADVRFLLFSLSNFLLYMWYDVPYVYLTDNAIELGLTETQSSWLISMIGILNMFGEIILGWLGDKPWADSGLTYAGCMLLCGAVTGLVPLLSSFTMLSLVAGAFGLCISANYALTSIILVRLITLERFTNAYGLLLLVQGVANLIGPPLAVGYMTSQENMICPST